MLAVFKPSEKASQGGHSDWVDRMGKEMGDEIGQQKGGQITEDPQIIVKTVGLL